MKQKAHPKPKYIVVFRPGKTVMKLALLGVIVLSTAALIAIHSTTTAKQAQSHALEQQAMALEQENQKLAQYNKHKGTDEGVAQVAQEDQGMVDPDTVIYDFG